jgi:hypothetical protein
MRRKTILKIDGDLPLDELPNHFWELVSELSECEPQAQSYAHGFEGQHHFHQRALDGRLSSVALWLSSSGIAESSSPGVDHPGIFFDSQRLNLPAAVPAPPPVRRSIVAETQETRNDAFHDSESEDIYDLYNACDGIVRDGLLDIRELDGLSQEESEALNVARLREIWDHTASGCSTCKNIVETLNSVRGSLRTDIDDPFSGESEAAGVNVIDSIS